MKKLKIGNIKSLRFDVFLIASLLFVSTLAVGGMLITREGGDHVIVEMAGEQVGKYPLYQNAEYQINGGTNVLVIENGEAYLSYADCPDHTCVRTGRIKYRGQSIVCLPNKVTVTVKGSQSDGVDFVS